MTTAYNHRVAVTGYYIACMIAILLNTERLDFYSTVDRYSVFIDLWTPVNPVAMIYPELSSAFYR